MTALSLSRNEVACVLRQHFREGVGTARFDTRHLESVTESTIPSLPLGYSMEKSWLQFCAKCKRSVRVGWCYP